MAKLQLQNFDQTLNPCAQSLDKNLTLWPNFTFQICTKLLSARFSSSTWVTVTTSTSFELSSSHQSSLLNSSELVSDSVTDKHSQWSDSGPIKICKRCRVCKICRLVEAVNAWVRSAFGNLYCLLLGPGILHLRDIPVIIRFIQKGNCFRMKKDLWLSYCVDMLMIY